MSLEGLGDPGKILPRRPDQATPQWQSPFTIALRMSASASKYKVEFNPTRLYLAPVDSDERPLDSETSDGASGTQNTNITLNFDQLPKPSVLGGWIGGYTEQSMRTDLIQESVNLYVQLYPALGRVPTQEEAETLVKYTAAGISKGSIGPFVGTVLALTQASRTSLAGYWYLPLPLRMPRSYNRSANFDPNVMRLMGRELLHGQAARLFHQVVRSSLYATTGLILGQVYARYQRITGYLEAAKDPKLVEIKRAITKTARDTRDKISTQMSGRAGDRAGSQETDGDRRQGTRATSGATADARSMRRAGSDTMVDDNSPTSGAGTSGDDYYASPETVGDDRFAQATSAEARRLGDEQLAEAQTQGRAGSMQGTQYPVSQARQQGGEARQSNGDGADFWSSSTGQERQTQPQASTRPVGSVWEQLRRGGNRPSAVNNSVPAEKPVESVYSASEDDKEKDQAQRDFDAMLERERSGSESSRKW